GDWSSDVCSSDLRDRLVIFTHEVHEERLGGGSARIAQVRLVPPLADPLRVSVRIRLGVLCDDRVDVLPHLALPVGELLLAQLLQLTLVLFGPLRFGPEL